MIGIAASEPVADREADGGKDDEREQRTVADHRHHRRPRRHDDRQGGGDQQDGRKQRNRPGNPRGESRCEVVDDQAGRERREDGHQHDQRHRARRHVKVLRKYLAHQFDARRHQHDREQAGRNQQSDRIGCRPPSLLLLAWKNRRHRRKSQRNDCDLDRRMQIEQDAMATANSGMMTFIDR